MKWFYNYEALDGALHPQAYLAEVVEDSMLTLWILRGDLFSPPGPKPLGFRNEEGKCLSAEQMWEMISNHPNISAAGEAFQRNQWKPRLTFKRFRSPRPSEEPKHRVEDLLP